MAKTLRMGCLRNGGKRPNLSESRLRHHLHYMEQFSGEVKLPEIFVVAQFSVCSWSRFAGGS